LADFFGVSIDYLLGRTDNPQAPWSHRGTPSKDLAEFARRLRRAREDRGLTVEDLAAEVGLTTAETARFEQAPAGFPAAGTLNRLAECLGVTMAYLVADVDDPHDPGPADAWYQPKELSRILEDSEIMFDGVPLTEEDKRRIKDILTGLFWEAKQMNRKRRHKSPPRHPSDP
jgi:transcriptional regulator with XRE-family HTH domain